MSSPSDCYCVCHSPFSSRGWCEHCHGDNVASAGRCGKPDPTNGNSGLCARALPCRVHGTRVPLRCRVGWHRWSSWGILSPRYCKRCGKDDDVPGWFGGNPRSIPTETHLYTDE